MNLVKEEPLPADAPPLPDENQSEATTGEPDEGEGLNGLTKRTVCCFFQMTLLPSFVGTASCVINYNVGGKGKEKERLL